MPYFPPNHPNVTSRVRLRGYDYASPGLYFLTVCIQDRSHRLGEIAADIFRPNDAGIMVERHLRTIPERFPGASLDACCLMPNHLHAIVGIGIDDPSMPSFPSVSAIMNWFKSATTVMYIRGVQSEGWPRFPKHLWLEGYHDHIIRTERDLDRIREYIESNATNWHKDSFYS